MKARKKNTQSRTTRLCGVELVRTDGSTNALIEEDRRQVSEDFLVGALDDAESAEMLE